MPRIDRVQFPSHWLPGRLLVVAGTTIEGINLFQVPISDEGLIRGPAQPLTSGPGMMWSPSVARDGRLALSRFRWVVHLWEQALDPESAQAAAPPRRLSDDATPKFDFSLTRDGRRLAFSSYSGPEGQRRAEIHLQDADGARSVPLSRPATATSLSPCLSPDGALLAWSEPVEGEWVVFVAPTGEAAGREVCRGGTPVAFLAEASELLVRRGRGLGRVLLADGTETPVFELDGRSLRAAVLSPDEQWLAALTTEPEGGTKLRLLPVSGPPGSPEEWVEVAGGDDRDDFVCVWGRRLDPATKRPVGDPFALTHAHTMTMNMQIPLKGAFTLAAGGDRLVFNAGEMAGDVYTAVLPE
jgi:hypothetical protein